MSDELIRILKDSADAITLGLVIGVAYMRAYRGLVVSVSFIHTSAVTVLLVALAVGAVLNAGAGAGAEAQALAFALVGLLGLIRFRTVVRDTRELSWSPSTSWST
jgi:putative exporter of polyketide antibiotics